MKFLGIKLTGGYNAYKKSRKRKSKGRGIKSRTRTRRRSMKRK
jgi:hypothetical protein